MSGKAVPFRLLPNSLAATPLVRRRSLRLKLRACRKGKAFPLIGRHSRNPNLSAKLTKISPSPYPC